MTDNPPHWEVAVEARTCEMAAARPTTFCIEVHLMLPCCAPTERGDAQVSVERGVS